MRLGAPGASDWELGLGALGRSGSERSGMLLEAVTGSTGEARLGAPGDADWELTGSWDWEHWGDWRGAARSAQGCCWELAANWEHWEDWGGAAQIAWEMLVGADWEHWEDWRD